MNIYEAYEGLSENYSDINEKEMFQKLLGYFLDKYDLELKRPYGDSYICIYRGNDMIGEMNYEGYNLLYNLKRLCDILKDELI